MRTTLRIMSANLWNGRADPEGIAELVASEDVDVLAVQELGSRQAHCIREVLPHGRLAPLDDSHHGMGVALRQPGKVDRLRLPYRDAHRARLEPGDWDGLHTAVEILNVHIAAPHVPPYPIGIHWRRQQLRQLERYLVHGEQHEDADSEPRPRGEPPAVTRAPGQVLVGDLNATPLWPVYRRLACHMTDAAVMAAQRRGRAPENTWGPRAGGPRWLRIDHGFVRGAEVLDFRVVPIESSDHAAVVVDLEAPVVEA